MEILETLIRASLEAGSYLRENFREPREIRLKGPNDQVTQFDVGAERIIREVLAGTGDFEGEELGSTENGHERTYLIDPIDGTKQYIIRSGYCCTSIGVEEDGELVGGVVNRFTEDMVYATYRGESVVRFSGDEYPLGKPDRAGRHVVNVRYHDWLVERLNGGFSNIPENGSFALNLARLADGVFDAVVFGKRWDSKPYDVAAGTALCWAAGVEMYDMFGEPYDYRESTNGLVAVRPEIKNEFLALEPFRS